MKNNVIFEPPSMRACSSTPPKQNQDFVKEHNRTPSMITNIIHGKMAKLKCIKHILNKNREIYAIKGIVHPKMKILSSFTHPQLVPNLYGCLCSAEHKGRYSEECGKQSSSGAPLTSIVFFFLLWKSMVPQNSLVTNFLQNIFLCVRQNKEMHTGLELLEGE